MSEQQKGKLGFWKRVRQRFRRHSPKNPAQLQETPLHTLKDALAIIILVFICLLAILQKMEFLAIATMVLLAAVIYKWRARQAMDIGYELLRKARTAKVGDFEFTIEQKLKDYSRLLGQQAEWIRIILSEMTAKQISLLLAIYRAERHEARDKDALRALRARGLLHHNAPTMGASTEVWLSELGKEVASHLLQPKSQQDVLLALKMLSSQEVEDVKYAHIREESVKDSEKQP
jgi:hypothetical protein